MKIPTIRCARMGNFPLAAATVVPLSLLGLPVPLASGQVEWVEWHIFTDDNSSFRGLFSDGPIAVDYHGGWQDANWPPGDNVWVPSSTYEHGGVGSPPADETNAIFISNWPGQHAIWFRNEFQLTEVTDPVFAIIGLGRVGVPVEWTFSQSFTILNSGPGYYGPGELEALPNNVLRGENGNGLIQFNGTFSYVTWHASTGEDLSAFSVALVVPAPATGVAPLVLLAGATRRRR